MAGQRNQGGPARERLVQAADELLRSMGLARVTTREIARAAGCSEAALYKYFSGKEDLFVTVLKERMPPLAPLLAGMLDGTADRGVEACLTDVVTQAARFYDSTLPVAGSLFAEPALLQRHREALEELGAGPHVPVRSLAEYLRREQARGRVGADVDPDAAAMLLLGACFQRAFLAQFAPPAPPPQPVDTFATAIVQTVLTGVAP